MLCIVPNGYKIGNIIGNIPERVYEQHSGAYIKSGHRRKLSQYDSKWERKETIGGSAK